jgi:hypothetical protein
LLSIEATKSQSAEGNPLFTSASFIGDFCGVIPGFISRFLKKVGTTFGHPENFFDCFGVKVHALIPDGLARPAKPTI